MNELVMLFPTLFLCSGKEISESIHSEVKEEQYQQNKEMKKQLQNRSWNPIPSSPTETWGRHVGPTNSILLFKITLRSLLYPIAAPHCTPTWIVQLPDLLFNMQQTSAAFRSLNSHHQQTLIKQKGFNHKGNNHHRQTQTVQVWAIIHSLTWHISESIFSCMKSQNS